MTIDQKPWRAEMPKTYEVPPPWAEGCCDSESVWHLVLDANANADKLRTELDAARARIAELEANRHHNMQQVCPRMDCAQSRELVQSMFGERSELRARIAELEAAESANLRAIGEASGAMYEPCQGPTWPGSWAEQVSVIRSLRESQRHETERFLRIEKLLGDHGFDCECECSAEEHSEDCERCFACKVDAALRGVSL